MRGEAAAAVRRMLRGKRYGILGAPGDPLAQPARSRLAWAHNTAQAVQDLGCDALLAGGVAGLPIPFDNREGLASLRRLVAGLHDLPGGYDLRATHDLPARFGALPPGRWVLDYELPRAILPYCGIIHTRHAGVLAAALERGLPAIYEDHGEPQEKDGEAVARLLAPASPPRLAVAASAALRDRLAAAGVPAERIIVLGPAIHPAALARQQAAAASIRRSLLHGMARHLFVQAGGMAEEGGIEAVLEAAATLRDAVFVQLGGEAPAQAALRDRVVERGLPNVIVAGALPQREARAFQQAADAVIVACAPGRLAAPLRFPEALAAGAPIAAAAIPALEGWGDRGLAIRFHDPGRPETLAGALEALVAAHPWQAGGVAANRAEAERLGWQARQRVVFERLVA
ncbi:glycosyltransferase [Falsiroseomonas ponticola]|uniref:glycosyltransferase n=1 Tax=Falsiroseomonas ponticola TaxID=2786951 RepID=UPI001931F095|nr:glycosyltransferase [Roseomonas ponticola]